MRMEKTAPAVQRTAENGSAFHIRQYHDAYPGADARRPGRFARRLRARLASDPHSPAYYRVNGIVRNFGPWYDAFGVPADAKLMLPADQRATFW